MARVDLHMHCSASFDCQTEPKRVMARCRQLGLGPVFLTDHDSIAGAVHLKLAGIGQVVVGEEVMTSEGELIGLFLATAIAPGLSPFDAATEIKRQGGLVYLEHPYDNSRRHLTEDAIDAVADMVDIVEVFNCRSDDRSNQRAAELRDTLGAAPGAGSDAHTLGEIGSVYVEIEDFEGAQDFLAKLRHSRIVRNPSRLRLAAKEFARNTILRR